MIWEYLTSDPDGGNLSRWSVYTGPERTRTGALREISKLHPNRVVSVLRRARPVSGKRAYLHIRLTEQQKKNLEELAWLNAETLTECIVRGLGLGKT